MLEEFLIQKQIFHSALKGNEAETPSPDGYLLKGDLSGIQDFIFDIQSDGAARLLKARSFFIQIAIKLCVELVCRKFKSLYPTLINDLGGAFCIKLSAKPDDKELKAIFKIINTELGQYGLFISLTAAPLQSWIKAMEQLKKDEELQKFRRHTCQDDYFNPFYPNKNANEVVVWKDFAKNLSESKGYRIEETPEHPGIYSNSVVLWNLKFLLETNSPVFQFDDAKSSLMNLLPTWRSGNTYFKALECGYTTEEVSLSQNKAGNYEAPKEGEIIDFDHLAILAKERTGTDNLGVLKLDVDNLGELFRTKFKTQQSFSDASAALGFFFGKHMKEMWRNYSFDDLNGNHHRFCDNILIVYSGGDDCLLLGGWDAVLEFTLVIRNAFSIFFDGDYPNSSVPTFSAAVILVQASAPVIQFGKMVTIELEAKAKERPGKNAINLFGEVFSWDEFDCIKDLVQTLSALISGTNGNPPESKALLQRIRQSAKGYEPLMKRVTLTKQVNFQKVWNLTWFILRNVKKENQKIVTDKIVSKYHDAILNALVCSDTNRTSEFSKALVFPAAARWTELLTRKITTLT